MPSSRHKALPVGLVVSGKKLLIIGGDSRDTVARTLHATLFDWDAIRILLPTENREVADAGATDSRMEILFRKASEDDVLWADVVVKDMGNFGSAAEITTWCRNHGKLLNCVDKPECCDLFYMSLLFRGPLVVGITSSGDAPALSAALRRHLETEIGPGWAAAAEMMAELRQRLPAGQSRMDLLKKIGRNSELLENMMSNNVSGLRKTFDDALAGL